MKIYPDCAHAYYRSRPLINTVLSKKALPSNETQTAGRALNHNLLMFGRTILSTYKRRGLLPIVIVVCALMAATNFQRTVEVDIYDDAMRETIEEMKLFQREGYSSEGRFKTFKKYSRRRRYKEGGNSPKVDALHEKEETIQVQREGYLSEDLFKGLYEGLFKAFMQFKYT